MHRYTIGPVSFDLREYRDLSFLSRFGTPFCVFDRNISGNIGFGMEKDGIRFFVKIAGLPTARYTGVPADAAETLRRAAALYRELAHPALIAPTETFSYDGLFGMVFPFEAGECLYDHWNFERYQADSALLSPAEKFHALPLQKRMAVLRTALSFLLTVSRHGYVAIDLYDGSILYDFDTDTAHLCDIDFFEKIPHINRRGLMWGDDKFRAPEEYRAGEMLDECTNVFRAGAMMFYCLGDPVTRGHDGWQASDALFQIAARAVSPDKAERYHSVPELIAAWNLTGEKPIS